MSELFNRFSFSSAKWDTSIALSLAMIWLVILGCAISSIRAQSFGSWMRRFWMGVVILLPVFGLLAYLPFSLGREDATRGRGMRGGRRRDRHLGSDRSLGHPAPQRETPSTGGPVQK